MEAGADVNLVMNGTHHSGRSALCLAAEHGHAALLELLASRGAEVNAVDPGGETALHAIWQCDCNRDLECYQRTQLLEAVAVRRWQECPIFWLRGLVPISMRPTLPPPPQEETWIVGQCIEGVFHPP